jgi:lysophospholipase L1-like esterase
MIHPSPLPTLPEPDAEPPDPPPRLTDYIGPMSRRRLIKLFLLALVYLVGAELAVRLLNPQDDFIQRDMFVVDRGLGFRMLPHYQGTMSKKAVPVSTNSWGLRDREYAPPANGTLRIYALGDSLVFGYGVPIEETYTRVLEHLLQQRLGRPVEVVNGGIPGYGTLQELAFLQETLAEVKPDVVLLVFSVLNDASDNVKFARRPKGEPNPTRERLFQARAWLREHSQLFVLLQRRLARPDTGEELEVHARTPTGSTKRGIELIEQSLQRFAQVAAQHGVAFGAVIAPAHRQVSPALWSEALQRYGLSPESYVVDQPNQRLLAFAERQGIPLLDLLPVLREHRQERLYWDGDGEHWEPRGHAVVAEATADFLVQHGLVEPAANSARRHD